MVDFILSKVIDGFTTLAQDEIKLVLGARGLVESLSTTLTLIRPALDDAEQQQVIEKGVRNWLRMLKGLAYDAEDIIDECIAKGLISRDHDDTKGKLCGFFPNPSYCFRNPTSFQDVKFRRDISIRVENLMKKMEEIKKAKDLFDFREGSFKGDVRSLPTSSLVNELEVVGRDIDRKIVIGLLCSNASLQMASSSGHEGIATVAIVGIGGLGKTTLAQLVFNDNAVKAHFDLKVWICVSADFDLQKTTKAIVEELSGVNCNVQDLNHVSKIVSGKRVLLVLDDVWIKNQEKWEALVVPFQSSGKGSRLLVTTRSVVVSTKLNANFVHELKNLSEDDCWSLLRRKAFGGGQADPELESIGRDIVKKCNGVPLAANSLGSLLRMKTTKKEWLYVKNSQIWNLPADGGNRILPALRLSYYHLPSHLKICFAYCCLFPKGYPIERKMLIELWMAEGFIVADGRREMEDIGNEYFNELLWRSFFQDEYVGVGGEILDCKMHGLVHDLACSVAEEDFYFVGEAGKPRIDLPRARHLSLVKQEQLQTIIDAVSHAASLRTFLVFWGASPKLHSPYGFNLRIGDAARNLIENCKLLRVLDLGGTDIISLPDSVGELKLLRYLDVSLTHIRELPESTSKLCNLQTLKVIFCKKLLKLPNALGNMIQLRHLLFDYCDSITYLPTGINQLTCLQTLHCFIVGEGTGCNNINELNALNNLSERLKITNLENVACKEDAAAANLAAKSDLVTLKLVWSRHQSYPSTVATNAEGILEALQPPVSIERLDMTNYIGPNFPSWLGSSVLCKLVEIVIDGAAQCIHLPTLGNLPLLKNLSVTGTNSVRFVRHEFYGDGTTKGFPSLERLEFCAMEEWEEWIGMDGIFKRLQTLYIRECPKLRSISNVLEHLSALQALWITSCHGLTTLAEELEQLNSLTSLRFVDCPKLSVLPKGLQHLPALQYLEIGQCPALTTLPWELQYLTALRALVIASCPKLTKLDNLMKFDKNAKCVSRLESLIISHCDGLVELPEEIRELVALKYLGIGYCIRLTALPTGIQRLNHLRTLQINGCPFIKKTLLEQKKEGWNHNLKIEVDYQTINQSSDGFAQKGGVISIDSEGQTSHRYKQITSVYCSRGYLE
ncbi:putative disease resistance protein RGA3 [Nymphaea colorata]|uniref:putative disease resistance protein RGA3 n=1 Tax=Nymphaea colorata TaxID=210225 RepID=UPI00129D7CBD|nr:putative disease resistance protein RGA3 [Nymphaea colorata]